MTDRILNLKFNARNLRREARETGNDLEKLDRKGNKLDKSFARMGKTAGQFTAAVVGVGSVVGISLARSFTAAAVTSENYRIRLNALLGSQREGNRAFEEGSKLAGELPFKYEDIMGAVTNLSGAMKGGVDEVMDWMPIIADLAVVSGLSIEQTTSQVQRMYSAGASSAELFRERGINAMIGFQNGVTYSAEETRKKLIEAYEDPASKFAGAAKDMALTWDGTMSQISDKSFLMKNAIMDEGVFDYFKAIATVINEEMGEALDDSSDTSASWALMVTEGIGSMIESVGTLLDAFELINGSLNLASNGVKIMVQGYDDLKIKALESRIAWASEQGFTAQRISAEEDLLELLGDRYTRNLEIEQNNEDAFKSFNANHAERAIKLRKPRGYG
jgi:phage tail tape-measure protein